MSFWYLLQEHWMFYCIIGLGFILPMSFQVSPEGIVQKILFILFVPAFWPVYLTSYCVNILYRFSKGI